LSGELSLTLVFASLASKDPKGVLEPFQGIAAAVRAVPIADHEVRAPEELAALANTMGFDALAHTTLNDALGAIRSPARVLLFGSLYLAGEALAANGQQLD
jgi:dihydrofolate synthase/folylpolyglutamate synthase